MAQDHDGGKYFVKSREKDDYFRCAIPEVTAPAHGWQIRGGKIHLEDLTFRSPDDTQNRA